MKKLVVVLILICIPFSVVFASNEGLWLGSRITAGYQGATLVYDGGRYDVKASLMIPVTLGIISNTDSFSWSSLTEMFLMDNIRLSGFYSVVNGRWFTLNVGAQFSATVNTMYYDSEEHPEKNGWGTSGLVMIVPSAECKFQINEKVDISLDARYPFPYFFQVQDNSFSGGAPCGIGFSYEFGNTNAKIVSVLFDIFEMIYDSVSLSVSFKL